MQPDTAPRTAHTAVAASTIGSRKTIELHAVLDQPVTLTGRGPLRGVTRPAGGTLCGIDAAKLTEPPAALFPLEVTCPACYLGCRSEGVDWQGEMEAAS